MKAMVSELPREGFEKDLERLARLFWDHPLAAEDLERHPVWVVERVLDYGDLEDVRALRRRYGTERFLKLAGRAVRVSPKTRRFWTCMLEQEGKPCAKTSSRPARWR